MSSFITKPIPDAMVEIWQANAAGRYASLEDRREELPLDEGFIGFGRAATSEAGEFRFRTVRPGRVPGPGNSLQAPHIAVSVFGRGFLKRLATRLYFDDKGDAGNFGSCNGDADDYSSRVGVATPQLTVPAGVLPRLSFDHYVASEVEFDGGNVKYSINGGAYEQVPDEAWLYNAPGGHLETAAGGNTNPMAGETAFTGTDGGQPTGSWGTSVIDLAELAATGDKVSFRFDFGMDGCNGIDGWYVDNVVLSICAKPVLPPKPRPATVAKTGTSVKGIVKIRVKVASGATPRGLVVVRIKQRTYAVRLVNGVLTVNAKSQMARLWKRGHRLVPGSVSYNGDAKVARFYGKVSIKLIGRQ